jgi:hypothetical protein
MMIIGPPPKLLWAPGFGTSSVLVTGHGGRRLLYLVLPGVPAAGARWEVRTAHVGARCPKRQALVLAVW